MDRAWFFLVFFCCTPASLTMAAQSNIDLTTDRSALLALKARITSDPQNMISSNWSTGTSVCDWVGVTCAARHRRVSVLNLSFFNLTGTIAPELGNLSFLVVLGFRNNSFHGSLPPEMGRLRRLKFLSFGFNNFIGAIPSWFGSFSKMETINLYGNHFSDSLPDAIFNLSALQVLDLSYNELSGSIPREIGNLTVLKILYLNNNNFKEIPTEIGTLDQLENLNMQENVLNGPIPMTLFNMSSLNSLDLTRNRLYGSLPDNICQYLPSIQGLHLSVNQFDGSLPSRLWQCKQLLTLSLSGNKFSGTIPSSIGNLTNLQRIYLGLNNLIGAIPDEVGYLQNLEMLSLLDNNLDGLIPFTIFNMSSINTISLALNQLSGPLPTKIGLGVQNLQQFLVGSNKLSGVIPSFISNLSMITTLDMPGNSFSGYIPSALCALPKLQSLNVEGNNLTLDNSTPEANIFSCLPNVPNLRTLTLSYNPLDVMFPASFGNLSTSVDSISLSHCNLVGKIPNYIGNLSRLTVLRLSYNQLSGSIPTSLGRLKSLQGLYLTGNKFQGHIPDELCQLNNLVELGLGGNQLSGSIPYCLDHLAALRAISLRSNLLTSTIPSTLWRLTYILGIDLSSNSLSGPLSADIGNLGVMTELYLSSNNFSGLIPSNIGGLKNLVNLSLANNNLKGSIPSSFGNLVSLQLLDLSGNNLSGVIPKSLEQLLHLESLNLSFNRLQGEIPTSGPFENFSAQSFASNDGLCGASRLHVPPCKRKPGKSVEKYFISGIISASFLLALVLVFILMRKRNVQVDSENVEVDSEGNLLHQQIWRRVSYLQIQRATNGFDESNLLGTGGFGSVYKGTFSDGMIAAIKVFNLQLEGTFNSFVTECEMLANLRHRNFIKIISCCSEIDFKAVVLNYMPNGSLEKRLHSHNISLTILQRLNIIIDVASALEYLHHGYGVSVVHCDLKPSNILLDDDMGAHVADFGIAKLLGGGDSLTQTMTLATIGYMAPEYGTEGIVSRRGDVYSFGILIMEIFTKRKPTDEMFSGDMSLKQWVATSISSSGTATEVVDSNLLGTQEDRDFIGKRDCLTSIMRIGLACSTESPEERINMEAALIQLNKIKIKFLKDTAAVSVALNPSVVV